MFSITTGPIQFQIIRFCQNLGEEHSRRIQQDCSKNCTVTEILQNGVEVQLFELKQKELLN